LPNVEGVCWKCPHSAGACVSHAHPISYFLRIGFRNIGNMHIEHEMSMSSFSPVLGGLSVKLPHRFPSGCLIGPSSSQKRTIFGWGSSKEAPPAAAKPPQAAPSQKPASPPTTGAPNTTKEPNSRVINNKPTIAGVKHIVAVASGKVRLRFPPRPNFPFLSCIAFQGGVGKSTVAVNLAMALMQHVRSPPSHTLFQLYCNVFFSTNRI
jgi:hypothetical protein